jgi:hypothetical protein
VVNGVSTLRSAAHVLDGAARSLGAAVDNTRPVLFNRRSVFAERSAHVSEAMRQAEEAVALLHEAGPRGETLAASMQQHVDYLHRVFDGRRFADARHALTPGHLTTSFQIRADRARLLDELADLDDASAQQLLERRLERPLRGMLAGDTAALREVAILAGMPAELRPRQLMTQIAPSVWDAVGASSTVERSVVGSDALVEAAAAVRRFELGALPATTVEARVQALLARDPDSLTPIEVRDLALAGTLPDRLITELDVPSLRTPRLLKALIEASPSSIDGRPSRLAQDTFLREVEALGLVRAGTAPTRRAATVEMADILDTPLDALTPEQVHRMSVLMHLPIEHRPTMPTTRSTFQLPAFGLRTGWQARADDHQRMLEDARTHFHDLRDPSAGLAELRRSFVEDLPFDVHRMAALLADRPSARAAGIDDAMIAHAMTRQLERAGTSAVKGAPLRQLLETSREGLAGRVLRPELEQVRAQTLELLDRNLDRMRGVRIDTFGRHPDYAEIGRVAANLHLIDAIQHPPAATAASSAAEQLTW